MPVRGDYALDIAVHEQHGGLLAVNLCADADRCTGCHTAEVELDGNSMGVLGSRDGARSGLFCVVCEAQCGCIHGVFDDLWKTLSWVWSHGGVEASGGGGGGRVDGTEGGICRQMELSFSKRFFATEEGLLRFIGVFCRAHEMAIAEKEQMMFAQCLFSFLRGEKEKQVVRPGRRGLVEVIRKCGVDGVLLGE